MSKDLNIKEKYESQVLVRSSASQTVTFPEENKVQIVSTARQQVGVSRFLDLRQPDSLDTTSLSSNQHVIKRKRI